MNVKIKLTMATLATLMLGSGCTKSSSSSSNETPTPTSTTLTISGSLQLSGSNASSSVGSMSANTKIGTSARKGKTNAFSASDYRVACATFEAVPKACGSTVDTAGAFALSCDGYKGVPFGCYVFNTVSYKNYPITFNIETSSDTTETSAPSVTSSLSSVSIVVDTDTGLATADATVEDPAAVTTIAVDTTAIGALDGTWLIEPKAYADVASKYSSDDFLGIKLLACFKTYWQTCSGMDCNPTTAKTYCETNAASLDNATAYDAMIQERLGGSGFPILLHSSTEGTKNYLSVWPDSASRAACGNIESGFTFKFSDGVDNTAQHKVDLDFSTSTGCLDGESANDCLVRKVGSSIESVVQNWFPMLYADVHGDTTAPTVTVNCKYMYNDLNGDIWNPNQDMINACQNNTGGITCMSGGDPMNATRNYVLSAIYSGVDNTGSTDAVLTAGHFSDLNFSDNVVAESGAAYGYGYRTWNPDTHTEEWNVLTNPTRTDLGGCLQWPDWSKCSSGGCTSPQYPTIIPVGQDVTNYGPDSTSSTDDNKWKCSFSEKRMLVQNANGYIDIGGTKYFEAQPFITLNSDSDPKPMYQSWSKICDVADGSNHSFQTYPVDMDSTAIQTEASSRAGGGSPEQKKGMYMQAIYEQLTSDDHGGGGGGGMNFYTSGNRSITCDEIKNGAASSGAALTWNEVNSAFKYSFGPWQVGQLIKCVMLGISAHHGSGQIYETAWTDLESNFPGVAATFAESSTPGLPIVFANLKSNSCIPKFQMTHMCTTDGFCSPKVICDDYNAADGGCGDGADPASRMAKMNIDALPNNFFRFFDVTNRYDVMFNPSTNSNIVCQRAEYMSITSDDAITSATTSVGMTFESSQAEINVTNADADCQGNALGASSKLEMPDPKMYTTFTKQ